MIKKSIFLNFCLGSFYFLFLSAKDSLYVLYMYYSLLDFSTSILFFATFVRSSARDFSFCIHGHAGWCHWKRILWGQNLYEFAFLQPIPRLLLILSTNLQLPLTLLQHVKDRATTLYALPFFSRCRYITFHFGSKQALWHLLEIY